MGLFHKRRQPAQWEDAYTAAPKFYRQPDGTPFGAIALTENTKTILPKAPQAEYAVDGQPVAASAGQHHQGRHSRKLRLF